MTDEQLFVLADPAQVVCTMPAIVHSSPYNLCSITSVLNTESWRGWKSVVLRDSTCHIKIQC